MPGTTETFVDITYQGLDLARRAKLTAVGPSSGYLEVAAPMPVGTTIGLVTDGGIAFTALVTTVHEQVAGSEHVPGMGVRPALDGAAAGWWRDRVTGPDPNPAPAPRATREMSAVESAAVARVADRERSDSGAPPIADRRTRPVTAGEVAAAVAAAVAADEKLGRSPGDGAPVDDGIVDDGKRTEVMAAVDPELLARLTGGSEAPIVDDGRRTQVMPSPPIMDDGEDDDGGDDADDPGGGDEPEPSPSASGRMPAARGKGKRRRNRRR